jgi:NitT/TauT family transport system substrate-binding protein
MAQLTAFRIGLASPANTFFAIWMARAAGLYAEYGLDAEIVPVVGGSQSGPDLDAGRIHLMHIGMSSVVRANSMGHDLVTIGSLSNIIRNTMFGAPGVNSAADLKGGSVGISSVGSETDPTTTLALRKLGLSREDVTIKEIGVERLTAVREGKVSASLMGEPYRSKAFALGMKPLIDLYADRTPWLYSGLVVSRAFLKQHRDLALAFIKATVEGNYLALADPARAKETLARELKLSDPKVVAEAYDNFKRETPLNAELTIEGARNIIDVLQPKNKDVNAYLDNSIQEELTNAGFFRQMKEKYRV